MTRLPNLERDVPVDCKLPRARLGLGAFESCFLPYKKAAP